MKKIVLLLLAVVSLASCTEEISRNSPALEGLKDGVRWRAAGSTATIGTNGDVTISGGKANDVLTLHIPSTNPGTYVLGNSDARTASFVYGDLAKSYSTATGRGDGQIIIEEYDNVTGTITGTFRFNAIDDDVVEPVEGTSDILNFVQGHFYKVPLVPAGS